MVGRPPGSACNQQFVHDCSNDLLRLVMRVIKVVALEPANHMGRRDVVQLFEKRQSRFEVIDNILQSPRLGCCDDTG